jgi:hypothetical protein
MLTVSINEKIEFYCQKKICSAQNKKVLKTVGKSKRNSGYVFERSVFLSAFVKSSEYFNRHFHSVAQGAGFKP